MTKAKPREIWRVEFGPAQAEHYLVELEALERSSHMAEYYPSTVTHFREVTEPDGDFVRVKKSDWKKLKIGVAYDSPETVNIIKRIEKEQA